MGRGIHRGEEGALTTRKTPKLLATCKPGKEEQAEIEILDCLLPYDHEIDVERTEFPGVLLVYSSLQPFEAYRRLKRCPKAYIQAITPIQVYIRTSVDEILKSAIKLVEGVLKPEDTFAVRCRKRGKLIRSSVEVERVVGKAIMESTGAKVDLENPQYVVVIEVVGQNTGINLSSARNPNPPIT